MLLFNNKISLPALLQEPSFAFDPDLGKVVIRSKDFRDSGMFSIIYNGKITTVDSGGVLNYTLPVYDIKYPISYYQIPSENKYQIKKYSSEFFINNPFCKNFRYEGGWESTHIYKYIGTESNIVIPDKHNLLNTLSAEITSFPKVSSNSITITTGLYMTTFNIKDTRITGFTVKSTEFIPQESQFDGLINLKTVSLSNELTTCPDRMFYNCKKLSLDPDFFKNITEFGDHALYNTYKQKVIRCSANRLESGLFDYDDEGVQKVIYTSALSINGLTNDTLITGDKTAGLLYESGEHEAVCNITDKIWTGKPSTREIIHNGYDFSNTILNLSTDKNSIAIKLETKTYEGEYKDRKIILPNTVLSTTSNNVFYENISLDIFDRIDMAAYDSTGTLTTKTTAALGELTDPPQYRIKGLFYLDGGSDRYASSTVHLSTTNDGYLGSVFITGRTIRRYIYCPDAKNNTVLYMASKRNGKYLIGKDGEVLQKVTLQQGYSRYNIYYYTLTDYYNYDELISYYSGTDIIFYRDYKYGGNAFSIPEFNVNEGSYSNEKLSGEKEYETWEDIFNFIPPAINGVPTMKMQLVYFTTEDNSTLTSGGEVYFENVPKYRAYFYIDPNCPNFYAHLYPCDKTIPEGYYYDFAAELNRTQYNNLRYIDLVPEYADEEHINSSYTDASGTTHYPYIRYGYLKSGVTVDSYDWSVDPVYGFSTYNLLVPKLDY